MVVNTRNTTQSPYAVTAIEKSTPTKFRFTGDTSQHQVAMSYTAQTKMGKKSGYKLDVLA